MGYRCSFFFFRLFINCRHIEVSIVLCILKRDKDITRGISEVVKYLVNPQYVTAFGLSGFTALQHSFRGKGDAVVKKDEQQIRPGAKREKQGLLNECQINRLL